MVEVVRKKKAVVEVTKKKTVAPVIEGKPEVQEPPKPKQKKPEPTTKGNFWKMLLNQRLVFQLKSGAIIEGTLEGEHYIFIKIVDAVITGKNVVTKTDWVMVDKSQVGHFHPVGIIKEKEAAAMEKQTAADTKAEELKQPKDVTELLEQVDMAGLDSFIGEQELTGLERSRYKQGKLVALRKKFVSDYLEKG